MDLSQARPLDRLWYTELSWAFDHLETESQKEHAQLIHRLHCSAIEYSAGQGVVSHHWRQAQKVEDLYQTFLYPWRKNSDQTENKQLLDWWESLYGKMDSPETERKINQTIIAMYKHAESGKQGSKKLLSKLIQAVE